MIVAPATVALALVAAGCSPSSAHHDASAHHPAASETSDLAPAEVGVRTLGHRGRFVATCAWSHTAPDDPILYPGEPGTSHSHDFFGNTGTDAHATLASLSPQPTTCEHRADRAAYWTPSLFDGDEQVVPIGADAYYRAGAGVDPASVEPYPPGLQVVAGRAAAEGGQPLDVVGWGCGRNPRLSTVPPACDGPELVLRVVFPDCWDGEALRHPEQAHMAASGPAGCPRTHPVVVPQLELVVRYPTPASPEGLWLASGGTGSGHADFFNAWDTDRLATEVTNCIGRDVVCG